MGKVRFVGAEVLVPVVSIGLGTGAVAVRDGRTGRVVRFRCPVVRLVGGRVCVAAHSHGVENGLHRVTLPGGTVAWVRVLTPELGQAA